MQGFIFAYKNSFSSKLSTQTQTGPICVRQTYLLSSRSEVWLEGEKTRFSLPLSSLLTHLFLKFVCLLHVCAVY